MSLEPALQRSAGAFAALKFHVDDLPVDVFEVDGTGLTVESLTGGHGMTETGASSSFFCACGNACACSCWQEQ